MKVLIDYDGELPHGLFSCTHTEGRWLLNLAHMLLDYGHEVDLLTPRPWRVERSNLGILTMPTKSYDFYFHRGWSPSLPDPRINAKINVIATFELEFVYYDKVYQIDLLNQPNWVLAYGFTASKEHFVKDHNPFKDKSFCIPVPLSKEFLPSAFDRLGWSINTHWTKASFEATEERAYGKIVNEFALSWANGVKTLTNLLGEPMPWPTASSIHEVYSVMSRVKFLGSVLQGGMTNLMAPFFGVIPLFAYFPQGIRPMPHTFPSWAPKELGLYVEHPVDCERLKEAAKKLMLDSSWYDKVLNVYREALKDHEWSQAYRKFEDFAKLTS